MKRKSPAEYSVLNIVTIFLVVAFTTIVFVVQISTLMTEPTREYFVVISSAICGGACTLIGVILTIKFTRHNERNNDIKKNIPELYVATRFDIYDATQIRLKNGGNDLEIANNVIYLKNTDKNSFSIDSLIINGSILKPSSASYIDKNMLFCLNFYYAEQYKTADLLLKSLDGYNYNYRLVFDEFGAVELKRI